MGIGVWRSLSWGNGFINDHFPTFCQLTSQAGVVIKAGDCEDNGEEFDECSSKCQIHTELSQMMLSSPLNLLVPTVILY